jgi:hypothetical protein
MTIAAAYWSAADYLMAGRNGMFMTARAKTGTPASCIIDH